MKKTTAKRRKTMGILQQPEPNKIPVDVNQSSSSTRLIRKASTPTHDKTARTESPDISRIMPAETMDNDTGKQAAAQCPVQALCKGQDLSVADQLEVAYTLHLQSMFQRKLAEAEANQLDDKLTKLQKRITENQNLLQKTTERLENINFNIEAESVHRLKNPNYGRILETLDSANCKEYLKAENEKLEQKRNQLILKNIELPDSGSSELLKIVRDTVAACEQLKSTNSLEVTKVIDDIKANNNSSSERLLRDLELVPEVENVILDNSTLKVCAKSIRH